MRACATGVCGALLLLSAVGAAPATSAPDELRLRAVIEGEFVVAEVQAPGVVDAKLRERLRSGLTNRLELEVSLSPEGLGGENVTATLRVEVVYDLWDERYVVQAQGAGGPSATQLESLEQVTAHLARPLRLPLARLADLDVSRRYRIEAVLAVNPVSQKVIERSREMMSPSQTGLGDAQPRSLLGSVARIFFNVSTDHGGRVLRGVTPYTHLPLRKPEP